MAKLTQQMSVNWAIQMLRGNPLPDFAPPKEEVIEGLEVVEQALERKTRPRPVKKQEVK